MKKAFLTIIILFFATFSFAQSKQTATDYIVEAGSEVKKKNFMEALTLLTRGINEMPDSVNLYIARATLFEALQVYDKALIDYSSVLERVEEPKMKASYLSNIGAMQFSMRQYKTAYNSYIKALEYDSTNIDIYNNLATVTDEVGKPDETLVYLYKVIEIDSNYTPAYVNIGFKYQVMEKYEESLPFFDKAVELDPEAPLAYSNRSYSRLKTGDIKGAMKDINYSLELFPANSYAYKIRALIFIEKNKIKKACQDLDVAESLRYANQYGNEVRELKEKYCK